MHFHTAQWIVLNISKSNPHHMTKLDKQKQAKTLRLQGYTYLEIKKELKVSKSSLSLWLRNIELTQTQKERISQIKHIGYPHTDRSKKKISKISKLHWKKNYEKLLLTLKGNSNHRAIEKEIKPFIEQYFKTSNLLPSHIGDRWFDFVNDKYIIEYTTDPTHGISKAIQRFEEILYDQRTKYLIAPKRYFGKKRMLQLEKAGSIFIPISTIKTPVV